MQHTVHVIKVNDPYALFQQAHTVHIYIIKHVKYY